MSLVFQAIVEARVTSTSPAENRSQPEYKEGLELRCPPQTKKSIFYHHDVRSLLF